MPQPNTTLQIGPALQRRKCHCRLTASECHDTDETDGIVFSFPSLSASLCASTLSRVRRLSPVGTVTLNAEEKLTLLLAMHYIVFVVAPTRWGVTGPAVLQRYVFGPPYAVRKCVHRRYPIPAVCAAAGHCARIEMQAVLAQLYGVLVVRDEWDCFDAFSLEFVLVFQCLDSFIRLQEGSGVALPPADHTASTRRALRVLFSRLKEDLYEKVGSALH
ncbi:hypothetical protein DQ04_10161010 [Trypanosoma grayi]|uniref:hypothetical protein n=1 Tax=Trypanosoma grayi TaxID=71804 RepID=UPI0004F4821E|nr:hypothetical protein DQ04_10161010 [Trypanosoma grayi]KEG07328.1 hypothetical protein DQ04_10161010 [Trypanosoma grayi]